jgi:predicted amidophosphoribosyltransferase
VCAGCRAELRGGDAGADLAAALGALPAGVPALCAAAYYGGAVRELLLAHKERGALSLAVPLGEALAAALHPVLAPVLSSVGPVLLVPVPSAARAVVARGHDPVRRMALAAARCLRGGGCPVRVVPALRHCRAVVDQSGLSAAQRGRNVAGAFGVRPGVGRVLRGCPAVLVDDLVTTGSTLSEAARALTAAGGEVLAAAVLAAAPRRSSGPAV